MSANLYDLLDVDETASTDDVRAAWKRAVADLDPTDRRFRAYNDAAEVLLDDERRASYDAELATARAAAEQRAAREQAERDEQTEQEERSEPTEDSGQSGEPGTPDPDAPDESVAPEEPPADQPAGPSRTLLVAAGVVALLALALAAWVLTLPGASGESPAEVADRAAAQERAGLDAEAAAEAMVAPVLSYHHETMAEDLDRLSEHLTDEMAAKQAAAWPELTEEAQAQSIVVEAQPAGTALTRVSPDGERATVVVFIDQNVEKAGAEPFVLRMWATMSLVRAGEGEHRWLLDDLCTDASCD